MNLFLNNKDIIDFNEHYDQWIFDLDNTIYDFNLGLFTKVSSRMTEYIKDFFDLNEVDALTLQRNMYKKYGLTLRGLMIEKKIDPEPFLEFVHDVDFSELNEDVKLKTLLGKVTTGTPTPKSMFEFASGIMPAKCTCLLINF